jgi:hypothetical protein
MLTTKYYSPQRIWTLLGYGGGAPVHVVPKVSEMIELNSLPLHRASLKYLTFVVPVIPFVFYLTIGSDLSGYFSAETVWTIT